MTAAEERDYLERVIAAKAPPTLSPAGTLGRLAQLHLEAPQGPGSAARALELVRAGLALESPGGPLYPKFRHFQAMALRALPNPPPEALGSHGTAAQADREAWKLSLPGNPMDALLFAQAWGDWAWARDLFEEAAEAYCNAQRAQTKLVLNETDQKARLKLLGRTHFATRGACALCRTGAYQQAILLLEQTSLAALDLAKQRRELLQLEKVAPQLNARLLDALKSMNEMHQRLGLDEFGGLSPEESKAQAERDSIVAEIRRLPGFASFAARAGWGEVVEASASHPLVYLVPAGKGSLAIAVAAGKGAARNIATVDIPASEEEIGNAYLAFAQAEYGGGGDRQAALYTLLEWLGSHVMVYVKSLLIHVSPQEGPWVLIPFGPFASLPLHVAMIHPSASRTQSLFHPRNVTFAYSGSGLAAAQRNSRRENAAARALVINNPRPISPEFDTLLLSDFEARMVAGHFPCEVLGGREADTGSVLEHLPRATVVHFSCHGTVDAAAGYSGVLLLANMGSLNYEDLRRLPELDARLVVFSACRSGSAALGVEYGVNLPNGFLAAGAAAVLGTLWHTDELASLLLLTRFYELWSDRQAPRTPAQALGDAQAWLMNGDAQTFRARLQPGVLESPASEALRQAAPDDRVYAHPWFWGGFFVAGA
jgi:CHAT domain